MRDRQRDRTSLSELIADLRDVHSRSGVCEHAASTLREVAEAERCYIALDERGDLVVCGSSSAGGGAEAPFDESVAAETHRKGTTIVRDDIQSSASSSHGDRARSLVSVPISGTGVVQLLDGRRAAFGEDVVATVETAAEAVGQSIDRIDARVETQHDRGSPSRYLEVADVLCVVLDADGSITLTNRKAREVLGYESGELVGEDWFETCVPAKVREDVRRIFDQLMDGQIDSTERYDNVVVTKGGDRRLVEWHNTVLRAGEEIVGTVSSGIDVTEERARQLAVEEERAAYETLLDHFPNGMVTLFDDDHRHSVVGGDILDELDLNEDELEGQTLEAVFPAENVETLRPLYDDALAGESNTTEVRLQGRCFRVTVVPVRDDAGSVIAGMTMSQDVTERVQFEETLTALQAQTRGLFSAETAAEIGQQLVSLTVDALDLPLVSVYRYDDAEGALYPLAHSTAVESTTETQSPLHQSDSVAWRVYTRGDSIGDDDIRPADSLFDATVEARSQFVAPIGDFGVFVCGDTERDAFDEYVTDLIEMLTRTAQSAFDRAAREQELRSRKNELAGKNRKLRRLRRMYTQLRDIEQILVRADTMGEIARAVCERLSTADEVAFAWIGRVTHDGDRITPQAWSGDGRGYLDRVTPAMDGDGSGEEPAVQTTRTGTTTHVEPIGERAHGEAWRQIALECGFQSALAVPLLYDGVQYGVLTLYADHRTAFPDESRAVLAELGETIARAMNAVQRKNALLDTRHTELTFEIGDKACFFLRFAQQVECTLAFDGVAPQDDDSVVLYVSTEAALDRLRTHASRSQSVDDFTVVRQGSGETVVRLRVTDSFIGSTLAEHGIALQDITADGGRCRVTVAIPSTMDRYTAVTILSAEYSDVSLVSKRDYISGREGDTPYPDRVSERLTDRQRDVARLAYRRGYFDSPKGATGNELAEAVDMSSSAFHAHLRKAEEALFATVFEREKPESYEPTDAGDAT